MSGKKSEDLSNNSNSNRSSAILAGDINPYIQQQTANEDKFVVRRNGDGGADTNLSESSQDLSDK